MLGNVAGARQVFEHWMEWQPEELAWHSYIIINFQLNYKDLEWARTIYERLVFVHPALKIKYAQFEEKYAYFAHAQKVYEKAVEFFGDQHMDEHLFVAFAKFKENQKKIERKKFGDGRSIENIRSKQRFQYEEEVKANPHNYGAWIHYLCLVESDAEADPMRDIYEGAIASLQPIQEKSHWKRYVCLWIYYALYEELEDKDEFGAVSDKEGVDKLMPEKVMKKREVQADHGSDAGWGECYDCIFPDDAANQPNLKLLATAKLWKKQQEEKEAAEQDPDKDIDEFRT
ncbi:Crooked neck-like protein 1 [Microtus ochrogaster]|uniref:Crooked neck-like protein 1 n=1 Tax=Microtus ochrogaster TaxID=79684 RepID=A0A8J6GPL7_MICOH|nr:Crooked neck-like protein 1 [Microtus ochrogaster]